MSFIVFIVEFCAFIIGLMMIPVILALGLGLVFYIVFIAFLILTTPFVLLEKALKKVRGCKEEDDHDSV